MRLDTPLEFQPYGSRIALLLGATLLTRGTAALDAVDAFGAALLWSGAWFACWKLRAPLRARRWPTLTPQWVGEAVAALGMLMFLATLFSDGILPALGALLCSLTGAVLVIAARRAHLLLLVATCLTQVLMVAAESRSALFVPCAAAFTLAVLTLFAFDLGVTLQQQAATTLLGPRRRAHGGALVGLLVLLLALPLYLYVPQPPALYLGGRSATTTHDYSDPRGAPSEDASTSGARRARDDAAEPHADADHTTTASRSARGEHGGTEARPNRSAAGADELSVSDVKRDPMLANVIVMYVKTSQPLYLRGKLLDRFVGDRWQRSGDAPTSTTLRAGYLQLDTPDGGARIAQQIDIAADLQASALFAAAGTTQIRFPAPLLYDNGDGTFAAARPLRRDTRYSIDATPRLIGSRYAIDAPPPDARYLQLDAALPARVRELAEQMVLGSDDAWHKALAIEQHLRSDYAYSYETVVPYQGRTPLDWFLFDTRKGHCEFFASAMVVLLREVGIPARLANGYSLGERNPLTGYYEVRVMDGHAWAEGWIDGHWVMFEPTPFYPLPHDEERPQQQVASETDRYLDRLADTSEQVSPASLRTELLRIARDAWSAARHLQRVLADAVLRALPWLPLLALLLGLAWTIGTIVLLAWRDTRESRAVALLLRQAEGGSSATSLAQALELTLSSRGLPRAPQRTWREYSSELAAAAVALPSGFADAFDAARYGGDRAPATAAQLRELSTSIRARLAAQPYPRLRARVQRWAAWLRRPLGPGAAARTPS